MLTYAMGDDGEHRISFFREGELPVTRIFRDHWLRLEVEKNGREILYYLLAHHYGTGEVTFISIDSEEFETIKLNVKSDRTGSANFKKGLKAYVTRNHKPWVSAALTWGLFDFNEAEYKNKYRCA
jgi:hypothetical protein